MWVLLFLLGIICVLVGSAELLQPAFFTLSNDQMIPLTFALMGIAAAVASSFTTHGFNVLWTGLLGGLMFLCGILIASEPFGGGFWYGIMLGILFFASAIVMLIAALDPDLREIRWLMVASSLTSVVMAFFAVFRPAEALGDVYGIELLVNGFAFVALSIGSKQCSNLYI